MKRTLDGNIGSFLQSYLVDADFDNENTLLSLERAIDELNRNFSRINTNGDKRKYLSKLKGEISASESWIKANLELTDLRKQSLESFKKNVKLLLNSLPKETLSKEKLEWASSPSILGFLVCELASKGYIKAPLHNGEVNASELARICLKIFDTNSTHGTLRKECNPQSNSLRDKKFKFTIPYADDLK